MHQLPRYASGLHVGMGALPVNISIGILVRNDEAEPWKKPNPTWIVQEEYSLKISSIASVTLS
jgi:hypothetical protein